jgi:predicted MPP superfamily phosphohydrolase
MSDVRHSKVNLPGAPRQAAVGTRINRRRWLKRAIAAAVAGVVVDTFWIEPHWLQIVRRELPIRNLPPRWQGRTLLQICDIHLGNQVSDDYLIRSFELAGSLAPDVVVMPGDFVSCSRDGVLPAAQARNVYAHLPQGKIATLGVLGNHDYGPRWSDARIASEVQNILSDSGLRILRNEQVNLDGLKIAGLDDLWSGRCDGHATFGKESAKETHLALCHNPDAADRDQWAGFQGWILSGHTHGGQCKPPFLPPPMLPVANRRYTSGEFDLYDGRRLYISRGLGHLLTVRFNCRPEISLFRLTDT